MQLRGLRVRPGLRTCPVGFFSLLLFNFAGNGFRAKSERQIELKLPKSQGRVLGEGTRGGSRSSESLPGVSCVLQDGTIGSSKRYLPVVRYGGGGGASGIRDSNSSLAAFANCRWRLDRGHRLEASERACERERERRPER